MSDAKTKKIFLFSLMGLFSLCLVSELWAIPTFARKYRTSCNTCHVGFSRLNAFGEAYRLNNYQIPQGQEEVYVKEEPVSLGAPAWKRVWPRSVWPGAIPGNVPLSMMVHQRAVWNQSARSQDVPEVDFDFPHEWELFAAGDLGDMFSFFAEFVFYEDGGVGGTERLYLTLNDLLAGQFDLLPEDALNLKIGKFDVAADPFPKSTRRTLTKYLPSDYTVGSASFKLRSLQSGLEAGGIVNGRLRYALGVTDATSSTNSGSEKNPYWRLDYKWGGMAFDGSGEEFGQNLKQRENWVDNSFTLGGFGYYGKEDISGATNDFNRMGFDCRLQWNNLDLLAAAVFGNDDDPNGDGAGVDTSAWFTQAEYVFYPWLVGALRYEELNYDDATNDVRRLVPSISIYARANVRLVLEGVIYPEGDDGSDSLLADLAVAF